MKQAILLIILGIAGLAIGGVKGGGFLMLSWLGVNFVVLGIAHVFQWHGLFGKRHDGTLPWWSWLLFAPLLLYSHAVWYLLILVSREASFNEVTGDLTVGRRLLSVGASSPFENYIDLTAEFQEPKALRRAAEYQCLPVLDASAPSPEILRRWVLGLRPGRTFVHCAQGHGRTGLFALAVLLESGAAGTLEEGLALLRKARPGIRLNDAQRRCLEAYVKLRAGESAS